MAENRLSARSALSRPAVVASAIEFVDVHGLPALTMRRLGRELGVEAMSLYRYVSGREDLLEAMVDELIQGLRASRPWDAPGDTWQGYLQWLATAVRKLAVDHPQVFPLIATRHPVAPWLRPPLRSLEVVEDFLRVLTSKGFSDDGAVTAYRAFSSFLLGHLLLEATQRSGAATVVEDQMEQDPDQHDDNLSDFPLISRLATQLAKDHTDEEFEVSLENILDRLEMI